MAEKFLEEIEEIEEISKELKNSTPDEGSYDIRNPKDADAYVKDIKDTLNLRLKVADMRRDVLSITKTKEAEENDALNIFYIALTAEEFKAMSNVEIHDGSDDSSISSSEKSVSPTARKRFGPDFDEEPDPFIMSSDGSLEEIATAQ
jgi:hypothetical protein